MQTHRSKATVTTPSDREIRIEREFDAPRDEVFATMLDPELIPEWCGSAGRPPRVDYMEPEDRRPLALRLSRLERQRDRLPGRVPRGDAPERIVQSWEWEGMPGHVSIETAEFEDLGDRTRMVVTSLFHTTEERDGMLGSGMEGGMDETLRAFRRDAGQAGRRRCSASGARSR